MSSKNLMEMETNTLKLLVMYFPGTLGSLLLKHFVSTIYKNLDWTFFKWDMKTRTVIYFSVLCHLEFPLGKESSQ